MTSSLSVTHAVEIGGLEVQFPSRRGVTTALTGVDLTIEQGTFVSLIGPSGCGKTTLLRSLATLVKPTSGSILVNGKSAEEARKGREVGFVFQSAGLLEWRDAESNVRLPLEIAGVSRNEARERAEELLDRVGLSHFRDHLPRQLSGGMQQRVSIARALTMHPSILLMDEPFAALDEITRERMNQWLMELWADRGITVVFVTHNIREATQLSDRIVVMAPHPGRIIGDYEVGLPRPRTEQLRDSHDFIEIRRYGEKLLAQAMSGFDEEAEEEELMADVGS
jgi:NitT/TauT family transport system ATP-binding protein